MKTIRVKKFKEHRCADLKRLKRLPAVRLKSIGGRERVRRDVGGERCDIINREERHGQKKREACRYADRGI